MPMSTFGHADACATFINRCNQMPLRTNVTIERKVLFVLDGMRTLLSCGWITIVLLVFRCGMRRAPDQLLRTVARYAGPMDGNAWSTVPGDSWFLSERGWMTLLPRAQYSIFVGSRFALGEGWSG